MSDLLCRIKKLVPEKRKKFIALLEQDGEKYQVYHLSAEQERMWYLYKLDPNNPYYNMVYTLEFDESVSDSIIENAVKQVVSENEMLHTVILETEYRVFQIAVGSYDVLFDKALVPESLFEEECEKKVIDEKSIPFKLTEDIPIRFNLISNGKRKKLFVTVHHMFADSWSIGLISNRIKCICEELLFEGKSEVRKCESYNTYVKWQENRSFDEERKYWLGKLKNCSKRISLPEDFRREKAESFNSDYVDEYLGAKKSDLIRNAAKKNKISVFSFLLTAFGISLSYACGQENITVGTPVFNRVKESFQNIVGCFANTIAVNIDVEKNSSVLKIAKQIHRSVLEGLANQSLPFDQVVDLIGVQREHGITPLYQVMFNLESESVFGNQNNSSDELNIKMDIPDSNTKVQFDLICSAVERNGEYQIGFAYKTELFKKETVAKLRDIFCFVLDNMLSDLSVSVDSLKNFSDVDFKCYDEKIIPEIEKNLQADFSNTLFKIVYRNFCYFVSYTGTESIDTKAIVNIIRKYSDSKAIIVHTFSPEFFKNDDNISLFKKMAESDKNFGLNGYCQFEKNSKLRENIIWIDDCESKQSTADCEILFNSENALPSYLEGDKLDEIEYKTLADLLIKAPAGLMSKCVHTVQYGGNEKVFSYFDLKEKAERIAAAFHKENIGKGDFVVLQMTELSDCIEVFWGCQMAGVTAIPLGIPQGSDYRENDASTNKLWNVCKLLENGYLVAGKKEASSIQRYIDKTKNELCVNRIFTPDELVADDGELFICSDVSENDIAVMLFTSGSTGIPKGVKLSHRNIIKRSQSTSERYDFDENEISLNWMPLDHVGGLVMYHILDVFNHAEQIQVETQEILRSPLKWITLLDKYRVTRTWAPNFAYGLVLEERDKIPELSVDLSCCKFILNGGEAINFTACNDFLNAFAEKKLSYSAMRPSWGMTETSSGILFSDNFGQIIYKNSVAVGTPNKGVKAKITDDNDNIVPQGTVGKLLVAGETINQGYFRNEAENKKCFVGDGWFDTGDYATIIDGEIIITGRNKDIVIVNGVNITCLEVEKDLEEIRGIMTGGVACCAVRDDKTVNDRVLICFSKTEENKNILREITDQMQNVLMKHFSIFADEFVALDENDMPRTAIGKIDKKLLVKKYQNHEISGQTSTAGLGIRDCMFTIDRIPSAIIGEVPKHYISVEHNNIYELKDKISMYEDELLNVAYYADSIIRPEEIMADISYVISELPDNKKTVLLVIMSNSDSSSSSLVKGYLTSVPLEESNIKTVLAVTDDSVSRESLLSELQSCENVYHSSRCVFFENNTRYIEQLKPYRPCERSVWRKTWNDKTTVILGGLGGIGFMFTQYILNNCNGRYFIIGKSNIEDNKGKSEKLDLLKKINAVDYVQCNFENNSALTQALVTIEGIAGKIDNIVNFTGDADASTHWSKSEEFLIRNLDLQSIEMSMRARNNAADEIKAFVTERNHIHVFMLSSITALFGGLSFGVYGAVSSKLLYSDIEQAQYTVIASSKWRDLGMSSGEAEENYFFSERLGFDILDANKDIEYLVKLFSEKPSRIIFGLNGFNYQLLKAVNIEPDTDGYEIKSDVMAAADSNAACESMTEQRLLEIWKAVLKNDSIKPDDKFFEVGGNSLKSINLISKINEEFDIDINVVDLFENSTVSLLAGFISAKNGRTIAAKPSDRIEGKMIEIWRNTLKNNEIGVDDKFFEAGGNSLKSISLIARINEEFKVNISVVDLFENATVRKLSEYISANVKASSQSNIAVFDL